MELDGSNPSHFADSNAFLQIFVRRSCPRLFVSRSVHMFVLSCSTDRSEDTGGMVKIGSGDHSFLNLIPNYCVSS